MNRPIIGILGNLKYEKDFTYVPREELFVYQKYIIAIEKNGGVPLILSVSNDFKIMERVLNLCDGLLLPGGTDVDPKLYGENPSPKLGVIVPHLDRCWYNTARYAIENNIPLLGICRGLQILNVAAGGTLYQDITEQTENGFQHIQLLRRDNLVHRVHINKGSKLNEILGVDSIFTNTLHHQAIKKVAEGFKVSAYAEDGIIEAIESINGEQIAVQWHPEELLKNEEKMNLLFSNLCENSLKKQKDN